VDDTLKLVVDSILKDFPHVFNFKAIEEKYPVLYEESMNTVLRQEAIRFNGLIAIVRSSLEDIVKALQGLVLMSQNLEECASSLYDGKVPALWVNI
jgi:dynein heavy chain, axonemal